MTRKQIIKRIGIVTGVIFIAIISYLLYVLLTYHRIEDNQILEITSQGRRKEEVSLGEEYSILTYNIGFGAYSSDYSFFMDGGKYSRAYNQEAVYDNTQGSIEIINNEKADFIFLQEVDLKSTRSYGVNQYKLILEEMPDYSSSFAINYDSAYLMYPLLKPHGKSKSGITTISRYEIRDSVRRSLPIDTSLYKLVDLDRCYMKSTVKTEDGNMLCLYHVHLSAYTKDESIVKGQLLMLIEDLKKEYEAGNYIICGGDFNQDLLRDSPAFFHTPVLEDNWAKPFPTELLPSGLSVAYDLLSNEEKAALTPSCRNADIPYDKDISFVTTVDGFILSDNVKLTNIGTVNNEFLYSDHNPVTMSFQLIPE